MSFCAFNKGIVHAILLQRLREQSLPMWPSTPHLQHGGPLPSLFVTLSDAATVHFRRYFRLPLVAPPCLAAVDSFRGEVLRAIAVHSITVFRAVFGVRQSCRHRME